MSTTLGSLKVILGIDATQATLAISNFEKSTATSLSNLNSKLQRFGYVASTALTLPIVMAGKASFQLAKDFEFSMQKIVGLTGVAQDSVDKWSKDILAMGPRLAKSPQELADALYFISSSGIKGAEAMNVLELSAKAASVGLGETKSVADYLTSALNAYRDTGLTAAYATDILVAGVREGKAEATGFASAMGQLIPIAANLGVSLDQVSGAMAAITLTGSSFASAAVYLKGVFNSLMTANDQGKKALEGIGLSYEDLRKTLQSPTGVIQVMQKFRDVQMKLGDEAIKDVLPNIRALTGFMSIAGKNFKYNSEMMERVTNSAGSLGAAWKAVENTIKIKFDRAISQANVSLITLGKSIAESFLPILEKWVKRLGDLIKWFDALTEEQKKHKIQWLAILAAAGPVSLVFSSMIWILRALASTVLNVAKGFIYLTNVIRAATGSTVALNAAMASSAGWTKFLLNPWVAAGAAIIAATALVAKYIDKIDEIPKDTQTQLNPITGGRLDISTDPMSGQKSIEDRIALISKLDQKQLETLQNDISTRIQLERDLNIKLFAIKKEGLKDDEFILTQKEIIRKKEEEIFNWKRNAEAITYRGPIIKGLQKEIDAANTALNEYKKSNDEYINYQLTSIPRIIKLYEGYGTKVSAEIKKITDPILKQIALDQKLAAESEEIKKIFTDLAIGEREVVRMSMMLGDEFDTAKAKTELYKKALEALASTTIPITDSRIKQLVAAVKLMNETVTKVPKTDITKALGLYHKLAPAPIAPTIDADLAFIQTFESELELIKLKNETLGESFNTTRDQMSLFKEILNRMWDDPAMRDRSDLFVTMTERIKQLTNQQYSVDLLTNAFTEFFSITKEGFQNFDEFIKKWISSVLQSFQRLIAELMAKKLANLLVNIFTVGTGGISMGGKAGSSIIEMLMRTTGKGFAKGGVVPAGYPNDSYHARLSSGETVLPKGVSNLVGIQTIEFEPVQIVIKENEMIGFLKKANNRKSLY